MKNEEKRAMKLRIKYLFALVALALPSGLLAQTSVDEPGRGDRGSNPLRNVYFG